MQLRCFDSESKVYLQERTYVSRNALICNFFFRSEFLKIRRRFAHPTSNEIANLLKKAAPEQYNIHTRKILENIAAHCQSCQRMDQTIPISSIYAVQYSIQL